MVPGIFHVSYVLGFVQVEFRESWGALIISPGYCSPQMLSPVSYVLYVGLQVDEIN